MQVILLERVENLGGIGDEVSVKNGFGRNYLIPQGKALRANEANRARFEREREVIEKRNADAKALAESQGQSLEGQIFVMIRQAGETGQLYGSVSNRDIVDAAGEAGHTVQRSQVRLGKPIKTIGIFDVGVRLHADVVANVQVNVARSEDEAERQAKGEDIIASMQADVQAAADEQAEEMAEAAAELEAEGEAMAAPAEATETTDAE